MNARIRRVRVYVDQAAVTWSIEVPATPDRPTVRFSGLPTSFEQETLRAEAWAVQNGERRPLDVVEVSSRATPAPADERRTAVQAELARIEGRLAELEDEESTDRYGLARVERYASAATRKISIQWLDDDPPIAEWFDVFDQVKAQRIKLAEARQAREVERQHLQVEKADRLAELQALGQAAAAASEVDIGLAGDLAADAWHVELTGLTSHARWTPSYELRLPEAPQHPATLVAVGLVRQSTGQDWQDIELIATTARPPLAEPPPTLRRLEVTTVPSDEDRTVISSHDDVARSIRQQVGGVDSRPATFEHTTTASIPAHGRTVRVELFTAEMPVTSQLEVAPARRTTPVEAATVDNTAGVVLLPGPVSVFRGANYAGQSRIGFVGARERFVVPIGTDGRIRVARLVHRSPGRRSSLTGGATIDVSQTTTIENLSAEEVDVIIRDRTPVARSDAATVKLMERPAELTVDPNDGRTEVRLQLAAHARRQLDVAYRITLARGVELKIPRDL